MKRATPYANPGSSPSQAWGLGVARHVRFAKRPIWRICIDMHECPHCEFPVPSGVLSSCPKCGEEARGTVCQGLLEVDVAHGGETWDVAREKIVKAVNEAMMHGHSGIKIIHGWGSVTGRSVLSGLAKGLVRSFALRYGGRVAPDQRNPGAHILWLNR